MKCTTKMQERAGFIPGELSITYANREELRVLQAVVEQAEQAIKLLPASASYCGVRYRERALAVLEDAKRQLALYANGQAE